MSNVDGECFKEKERFILHFVYLVYRTTSQTFSRTTQQKAANKNGLGVSAPYMSPENTESATEERIKDGAATGDMTFLEQLISNFRSFGSLILSIS